MIIVQLNGGLGNQMFQYAAGRSLAVHHNTELKLDVTHFSRIKKETPRQYNLSPFRIKEVFASGEDLHLVKIPSSRLSSYYAGVYHLLIGNMQMHYKKEPHFHFDPDFLTLPDNVYIEGYWQSEKYFKTIENVIRSEFRFKEEPDSPNRRMSEEIMGSNGVSIHIRRGDFVTNPATFGYHGICTLEYYHRAINIITQKISDPHFYIFSDDPLWVKQNLEVNYPHTYITHNQGLRDYMDLWLMSLCQHHIIANSSFSWWGAWLCSNPGKIVIAPQQWFGKPDINTQDLLPDSWDKV